MRSHWDRSKRRRLREILADGFDGEAFLREVIGCENPVRVGDEISASCPLPFGLHSHGDQSPSFRLNDRKLVCVCYVCGGGDVLWLVQNVLGVGPDEAIRLVRGTSRSDLRDEEFLKLLRSVLEPAEQVQLEMPRLSEAILAPWRYISPYLVARGVSEETQKRMRTGVDLGHRELVVGDWTNLPRLVVPHFFDGALRGWQKRLLLPVQVPQGERRPPKYLSSPGMPKDRTLYGWDELRGTDRAVVVESPMSVLRMLSDGWHNPLGTFGVRVTDEQVALLRRFEEVVLFFDAGQDGRMATASVTSRLERYTRVRAVVLPYERDGWDPGDMEDDERRQWMSRSVPASSIDRRWNLAHQKAVRGKDRGRKAGAR